MGMRARLAGKDLNSGYMVCIQAMHNYIDYFQLGTDASTSVLEKAVAHNGTGNTVLPGRPR